MKTLDLFEEFISTVKEEWAEERAFEKQFGQLHAAKGILRVLKEGKDLKEFLKDSSDWDHLVTKSNGAYTWNSSAAFVDTWKELDDELQKLKKIV